MSAIDKMNSDRQKQADADARAIGQIVMGCGNDFILSILHDVLGQSTHDIVRREAFRLLHYHKMKPPEDLAEESKSVIEDLERSRERKKTAAKNAREKKEAFRLFNEDWQQRRKNPSK